MVIRGVLTPRGQSRSYRVDVDPLKRPVRRIAGAQTSTTMYPSAKPAIRVARLVQRGPTSDITIQHRAAPELSVQRRSTTDPTIQRLFDSLARTARELERATTEFDALVQQYSRLVTRDPERMALHLRSRLEGLTFQADFVLRGLKRLAAEVESPARPIRREGVDPRA